MKLEWQQIDAVLLDMDGTLLDLQFDNDFWLRQVPHLYANHHDLNYQDAEDYVFELYDQHKGTLQWYCTDFWSEMLDLEIIKHKADLSHKVTIRPGTVEFLQACKKQQMPMILVTNAHPATLAIKLENSVIGEFFEQTFSSHQFSEPKESKLFWSQLEQEIQYSLNHCLFIDDSEDILQVAEQSGVKFLRTISQPDLSLPERQCTRYPAVNRLDELL